MLVYERTLLPFVGAWEQKTDRWLEGALSNTASSYSC